MDIYRDSPTFAALGSLEALPTTRFCSGIRRLGTLMAVD